MKLRFAVWDGDGARSYSNPQTVHRGRDESFQSVSLRRERDALTVASSGTVASSAPGVQNARLTVGVHSS